MTSDCTPRYCRPIPRRGGRQAVAEAWRNITAVGATPLAVTDNMNFGNPQKPEIMGQFAGAIEGMAEACTALDFPVVSGNVSLYNETEGRPILPTPDHRRGGRDRGHRQRRRLAPHPGRPRHRAAGRDHGLARPVALSARDPGPRGRRAAAGRPRGRTAQRRLRARRRSSAGRIAACHDLSDGGLLVGLAEMCLAGGTGVTVKLPARHRPAACLPLWRGPGPLPGRRPTMAARSWPRPRRPACRPCNSAIRAAPDLVVEGLLSMALGDLRAAHEAWLPDYMNSAA